MNAAERMFNLKDKIAIVTGAAGQLGGEYVQALIEAGASVAAFDVWLENPKSKLNKIKSERLIKVKADITDKNSLRRGLETVVSQLGNPNVLINNAALDAPPNANEQNTGFFEEYPEDSWEITLKVNLTGVLFACQVIGGHMAGNGGGSIINISSIYGILSPDQRIYEYKEKPFFKPVSYSVTKSGILNFTRYLATYWAKKHVRVNTLTLAGVFNNQDETFLKNYTHKVPLGRMANENEYNGAILFLASDASSYMTGANLVMDGGYSCW